MDIYEGKESTYNLEMLCEQVKCSDDPGSNNKGTDQTA